MGIPVLVVDDDDGVRESLRWLLEEEGYTVYEAPDGEPALDMMRSHAERMVVLVDLNMPGMDGMALVHAIEDDGSLAARHAYIVMTANGRTLPLAFVQLLSRLQIPVVSKPFDLDKLLAVIADAAHRVA